MPRPTQFFAVGTSIVLGKQEAGTGNGEVILATYGQGCRYKREAGRSGGHGAGMWVEVDILEPRQEANRPNITRTPFYITGQLGSFH